MLKDEVANQKKFNWRIVTIFILPFALVFGYWFYKKKNNASNPWLVNEFKPQSIFGSITRIDKKEGFQTIGIRNGDSIMSYSVFTCKENEDLIKFISVGDSIVKFHNQFAVRIIKQDGSSQNFDNFLCP